MLPCTLLIELKACLASYLQLRSISLEFGNERPHGTCQTDRGTYVQDG